VFMDANYSGIEGMAAFTPSLTVLATVTSKPSLSWWWWTLGSIMGANTRCRG